MSPIIAYHTHNLPVEDFLRSQRLSLEQLISQNGLTINPETASNFLNKFPDIICQLYIDALNTGTDDKSPADLFERVVDLALSEKDSEISEEDRTDLVKLLEVYFSERSLVVLPLGGEFVFPRTTNAETSRQEVPTTYIPPKVEISDVSPQEFFAFQKEMNKDLLHEYGSNKHPIVDRLYVSIASIGNARIVNLDEYSELCRTSLGDRYNTIKNSEWLQLRRSTYPFSVLSDIERDAIRDNIEEIISYAISAGLLIVVIYLVIEVEKLKHKKSQIINTSGGDVVLENGYLDKREGIFVYVTLSEENNQTCVVEQQEVKGLRVEFNRPTDKPFKAVTVLVDPDNKKLYAFPTTTDYLTEDRINSTKTRLGRCNSDLGKCIIAPLLIYDKNRTLAKKELIKLLKDKSAIVRAVAADVLGEIREDDVAQELGVQLRLEKHQKVIKNILSSLLDIGSENAIHFVFGYAANHDIPELMIDWCAERTSTQSLLSLFRAATSYPCSKASQEIFERTNLRNIDLEPIIREFNSNTSDNVKLNMAKFFGAVLEEPLDKRERIDTLLALTRSMVQDNQRVAVEIARDIANLKTLDSEDVNIIIQSLDSPYAEVRKILVKRLGDFLKK